MVSETGSGEIHVHDINIENIVAMETGSIRPKSAKGRLRSRPNSAYPRGSVQTTQNPSACVYDIGKPPIRPKSAHPRSRSRMVVRDITESEKDISQQQFRIQQSLKSLKSKHNLGTDMSRVSPRSGPPPEAEMRLLQQAENNDRKLQHRRETTEHNLSTLSKHRTMSPMRKSKLKEINAQQNDSLYKGSSTIRRPKTPAPTLQNLSNEDVQPSYQPPRGILKNVQTFKPNVPNTSRGVGQDTENSVGTFSQKHNNMDYHQEKSKSVNAHPETNMAPVDRLNRDTTTAVIVTGGSRAQYGPECSVGGQKLISPYIDEMEYYSNLDPVEYFADTTIRDLPLLPIVTTSPNHSQPVKKAKSKTKIPVKLRPWSEGMAEKEQIILSRKKCINTKNSVYAMFFEEKEQGSRNVIDYSRYVAMPENLPIEDDIAKGNSNKIDVHASGRNQLKVPENDLSQTVFANNAIQFQQNNKWTSSLPPKYPTPIVKNNLHDKRNNYIKNDINSVLPIHLQKKGDRRPFSEGRPINMSDKELLRFTSNANLYARTTEKVITKYKKTSHGDRPRNLPTGLEKKPKKGAMVTANQFQLKTPSDVSGRATPHPPTRKLKPVHATYK